MSSNDPEWKYIAGPESQYTNIPNPSVATLGLIAFGLGSQGFKFQSGGSSPTYLLVYSVWVNLRFDYLSRMDDLLMFQNNNIDRECDEK